MWLQSKMNMDHHKNPWQKQIILIYLVVKLPKTARLVVLSAMILTFNIRVLNALYCFK